MNDSQVDDVLFRRDTFTWFTWLRWSGSRGTDSRQESKLQLRGRRIYERRGHQDAPQPPSRRFFTSTLANGGALAALAA